MSFNAASYIKPNVVKEDVLQIKKAFDSIDLDHSNSISPGEIRALFQRIEFVDSKDAIYDMLKEMDEDYSGGVDFDEFFTFITSIFDEKGKREEIRKLLKKAIEPLKKVEPKKEDPKKPESKKPESKEKLEKTKEAGVSREKQKKEVLRSKPKTKGGKDNAAETNENGFDAEPYIKAGVTKDTIIDLKKAFDLLDEDGSGVVAPNEIQKYFEKMGKMTKNRLIYQLLKDMDKDNSGGIDFDEFVKFITQRVGDKDPNLRDEIAEIFAFFDNNGNGKVSWTELKIVAQFLGEEMSDDELKEMFVKADLDDDGFVTVDDFMNIWTGQGYY